MLWLRLYIYMVGFMGSGICLELIHIFRIRVYTKL